MGQAAFDGLTVLYRTQESKNGCVELCTDAQCVRWMRICIYAPTLQRRVLGQLPEGAAIRMAGRRLEVLSPWQDGQTLEEWFQAVQPTLGQRRDLCLTLLKWLMTCPMGPDLLTLSAQTENLRVTGRGAVLLLCPVLNCWQPGLEMGDLVREAAGLMKQILTQGFSSGQRRRFPDELVLILLRCQADTYTRWEDLQQDVANLPNDLRPVGELLCRLRDWLVRLVRRYGPVLTKAAVLVLAVAALFSLVNAVGSRSRDRHNLWPGMMTVGDQDLRGEEGTQ